MTDKPALLGLNCPKCGGIVPVPEGQVVVRCPYCDLRSLVRGEQGVRRYQVAVRLSREQAAGAMKRFLSSSLAIAPGVANQSELSEAFLAYLPFWTVRGRVAGYAFGKERVGSGDRTRYEPREIKIVEEMSWNGAACDVGEFGVNEIPLGSQPLTPFDADALHASGLVFEPAGSFTQAKTSAERDFEERIRKKARLARLSQLFVRSLRHRFSLVYYPLWVLRYLNRGRAYQVVVDGFSGQVLYGKAPGNTLYRAAVLVLGMALGMFLALDVSTFLAFGLGDEIDETIGIALLLVIGGIGMMTAAYRVFRYGEHYEYRHGRRSVQLANPSSMQDVVKWLDRLS